MRTRNLIVTAIALVFGVSISMAQSKADLPSEVTNYVDKHFSGQSIDKVEIDEGDQDEMYEIKLSDGTELDFDAQGEIVEIDSKNGFSADALPMAIAQKVKDKHGMAKIVDFEKENDGYEIEFEDGTEVDFDTAGNYSDKKNR